jgi:hypothetical protein
MRPSFVLLAAALLAANACSQAGPADEGEEEAPQGPDREAGEHALISVAHAGDGACTVRWDGRPIANDAVQDRAVRALELLVEQAGGPQNMMTIPRVVLEAPQAAPYSCWGGPLEQLASAGFGEIALRFGGRGPGADRILQVPIPTPAEPLHPFATLDLGADGRARFNGQVLDAGGLQVVMLQTAAPLSQVGVNSGSVLIRPEPAAPFGGLYEIVALAMEGNRAVAVQPRGAAAAGTEGGNKQAPAP